MLGSDHIPSGSEWQALLRSRRGGGLLFYGPGRTLSHCAPGLLAGLSLATSEGGKQQPGCNAVFLLDRADNSTAARRQAKLDSQKDASELALEVRRLDIFTCCQLDTLTHPFTSPLTL